MINAIKLQQGYHYFFPQMYYVKDSIRKEPVFTAYHKTLCGKKMMAFGVQATAQFVLCPDCITAYKRLHHVD